MLSMLIYCKFGAGILFSRIAFKHNFATLKIGHKVVILLYQKKIREDFTITKLCKCEVSRK